MIAADAAAIFVDGRYTLQVRDEAPADVFEYHHVTESPPSEWLRLRLRQGDRLGYDPWLHTIESVERLQAVCGKVGATLVPVAENLVDRIWDDQPPPPRGPIVPHDLKHAGRPSPDKRREIGELLAHDGVDAVVLTAPDSIAWLLNVRGSDVAHTPLPLAFAVAHRDATVDLFVDPREAHAWPPGAPRRGRARARARRARPRARPPGRRAPDGAGRSELDGGLDHPAPHRRRRDGDRAPPTRASSPRPARTTWSWPGPGAPTRRTASR